MAQTVKVRFPSSFRSNVVPRDHQLTPRPGGKAKPLKAAKKQNKDLDEDDLAHHEKQKAGTIPAMRTDPTNDADECDRREGPQGDGGQGWRQGSYEQWKPGHQEEWQEISTGSGWEILERRPWGFRAGRAMSFVLCDERGVAMMTYEE